VSRAAQCINCFGPNEPWSTYTFYGDRGTFFADVTGDDKADAIVVNDATIPFGRVVVRPLTSQSRRPPHKSC
jgi:hypothetical protein